MNLFWFERVLRVALGMIMIGVGFLIGQLVVTVVGGIMLFTGTIGYCPLVALFGHKDHEEAPKALNRPATNP